MSQTKSRERETVEAILDALMSGKVKVNPDGWEGTKLYVRFDSPAGFVNDLVNNFKAYAKAEESDKEAMAKVIYGNIVNARLGGLLVGETSGVGEVERLNKENTKLRDDLKRFLAVATGQGTSEAVPYQ
ncbi:hypothetical protein E6H31_03300 [Candidatus Bathyarchaeota archaeon]|nr:MAG: hypothetical protein E6H31_03300 [Candidatus Bathyarchaeota archaeon]